MQTRSSANAKKTVHQATLCIMQYILIMQYMLEMFVSSVIQGVESSHTNTISY